MRVSVKLGEDPMRQFLAFDRKVCAAKHTSSSTEADDPLWVAHSRLQRCLWPNVGSVSQSIRCFLLAGTLVGDYYARVL